MAQHDEKDMDMDLDLDLEFLKPTRLKFNFSSESDDEEDGKISWAASLPPTRRERTEKLIQDSREEMQYIERNRQEWVYIGSGNFTIVYKTRMKDDTLVAIRKVRLWNGSKHGLNPNEKQLPTSLQAFDKEVCLCLDDDNCPYIYGAWKDERSGYAYMVVEYCRSIEFEDYKRPIKAFMEMFGGDMHTVDNVGISIIDQRIVRRDTGQQPEALDFDDGENQYPIDEIVKTSFLQKKKEQEEMGGCSTPLRHVKLNTRGLNTC